MADATTSTNEMLAAAGNQAPTFIDLLNQYSNSNIGAAAQANLSASQAVTPQYNQLLTSLLREYAPQLTAIGLQTGLQTQQGQADNNAAVANSAGGQAALNASIAADRTANPEYYASRANESNALASLLGTDVAGLSGQLNPSEMTAIGQSIAQQGNQTGTYNTPSAIQTTANAMNYGNAVYNRQEQAKQDLSSALGQATSFLPASQSQVGGMNAWNTATGGPSTSTAAAAGASGLFQGTTNTASGSNANAIGSLLGNVLGSTSSSFNSGLSSDATKQGQDIAMPTNYLSGMGSFFGGIGSIIGGINKH